MSSGEEDNPIEDANDLEIIQEGYEDPENNGEAADEAEEDKEESENKEDEKKEVKVKRVVRNPQPKLNDQTLKGPKGIAALAKYFERVKFKGRGYEEQDLNVLLKTYEYWCHRLFPKFPFEDCIEKLEKLGAKKNVQTHLKRIRMDINFDEEEDKPLDSDDEMAAPLEDTTQNTPFDDLVRPVNPPETQINEEQLERMRQNKERAERLRQEILKKKQQTVSSIETPGQSSQGDLGKSDRLDKLKKIREKASSNLDESNLLPPSKDKSNKKTSDDDISDTENKSGKNSDSENEDNIENLLDVVNKDNKNKSPTRSKKNMIDSDNEEPTHEDNNESLSTKKKKNLIESDSEPESANEEKGDKNKDSDKEDKNTEVSSPPTKKKNIIESDSEPESTNEEMEAKNSDNEEDKNTEPKKKNIIESDSEPESTNEEIEDKNLDSNKEDTSTESTKKKIFIESDSEPDSTNEETDYKKDKNTEGTSTKKNLIESYSEAEKMDVDD
ncbi:unnamed protein product [Brassicogethes aeneus]|uniref:TIMELESS-interacting protein n=1 Tax=Brassicogethes aeneus TaxID=1431903 RepID=A0A9P0FDS9_BRAAE|nr:unnamed protein product [Brassicogethes aeneus]